MNTPENRTNELHVVFGTGPVGLTLTDVLLAQGKRVRLINRSGRAAVPDAVELIAADATNPDTAKELCWGAAAIYHCANVPYTEQYEVIPRLQDSLIAGAGAAGAALVVTDTLYMYGETHGRPMTEDTPHAATTRKGRMRSQVARKYLQAHRDGTVQVALGRAADFFGPRVFNSALGERVFPPALAGKPAQVLGNVNLPHSYSYIKDVARGLATLGERLEALGREWLLPVTPAVTTREMIRLISEAIGHPVRIQALPKLMVQAAGLFNPQMREMVEMFYQYTEPQIVDSRHFEEAFGWGATPAAEAIQQTVDWFRARAGGA
jgi:nucleoside-diphosphate-sugar epimerase